MLIIVEGPDRVGKSTFIREARGMIAAQGRRVISMHRGAPDPDSSFLHDYAAPIATYEPTTPTNKNAHSMICDRLHLGDLTYGPIYRGECRGTAAMQMFMDGLIEARGGIKIHMTADPKLIQSRIRREGEENSYLKIEDVPHIVAAYEQICSTGWIDINTTGWRSLKDTCDAAKIATGWARDREREIAPIFAYDPDYVGIWRPRFLFVGSDHEAIDGHEHTMARGRSYAAFTPWPGTAAEYLLNAMIAAGFSLGDDAGITTTASPNLAALHVTLGVPKIIAVGDAAHMAVESAGLKVHAVIAHPALEISVNGSSAENARYVKLLQDIRSADKTNKRKTTNR